MEERGRRERERCDGEEDCEMRSRQAGGVEGRRRKNQRAGVWFNKARTGARSRRDLGVVRGTALRGVGFAGRTRVRLPEEPVRILPAPGPSASARSHFWGTPKKI